MKEITSNLEPDDELQPCLEERRRAFWAEFHVKYPTDVDGMEELIETDLKLNGRECRSCESTHIARLPNDRKITCDTCKKTQSLTAGTFFHNMRRPRAWLAAIQLIESGLTSSIAAFIKNAGVAYSTAWNIFKKIGLVIERQVPEAATVVTSSVFSDAICRRSSETPARAHPRSEILPLEGESAHNPTMMPSSAAQGASSPAPDETNLTMTGCADSRGVDPEETQVNSPIPAYCEANGYIGDEKTILDLLSDEPTHFDVLLQRASTPTSKLSATLTMLEMAGAVRCIAGDWYVRMGGETKGDTAEGSRQRGSVGTSGTALPGASGTIEFLLETFKGVALKYLQLYLAILWCHTDKVRWPSDSLLKTCLQADPITDAQVRAYVSPALVRVVWLTNA